MDNNSDKLAVINDSQTNFEAFMQVLDELTPQIIYVWYKSVRDVVVSRLFKGLKEQGQFIANGITVYCFTYNMDSVKKPADILSGYQCNTEREKDHRRWSMYRTPR